MSYLINGLGQGVQAGAAVLAFCVMMFAGVCVIAIIATIFALVLGDDKDDE